MNKEYYCCICKKKLDYKPIRLVKQEYGAGKYNQYYPVKSYDFCKEHYAVFNKWINKYKEVNR